MKLFVVASLAAVLIASCSAQLFGDDLYDDFFDDGFFDDDFFDDDLFDDGFFLGRIGLGGFGGGIGLGSGIGLGGGVISGGFGGVSYVPTIGMSYAPSYSYIRPVRMTRRHGYGKKYSTPVVQRSFSGYGKQMHTPVYTTPIVSSTYPATYGYATSGYTGMVGQSYPMTSGSYYQGGQSYYTGQSFGGQSFQSSAGIGNGYY